MDNTLEARKQLILATFAFAVSFALWGMISPLAKSFQMALHLSESQVWALIATPVLLGSVMRLPMGMLTDRFGGRLVFSVLLFFSVIPAFALSIVHTYTAMLIWAMLLGMAGTSFSIGVGFSSRWFPPENQGFALGIFGAGNIGQSLALFGIPALTGLLGGWQRAYQVFGIIALLYAILFTLLARDAPSSVKPKTFGAMFQLLATRPLAWLLSLFYFVTFGGFVALSIGLPKLLQGLFHLTTQDAGLRAAGFVLLATAMRPVGGLVSDKIGGAKALMYVFAGTTIMALGMISTHIVLFTISALCIAALIGLGNGSVFKLVPQYFGSDTGTVTGLVGAVGGLGGFFPPLALGFIKTSTGSYALGFVFLSLFCLLCLILNWTILLRKKSDMVQQAEV